MRNRNCNSRTVDSLSSSQLMFWSIAIGLDRRVWKARVLPVTEPRALDLNFHCARISMIPKYFSKFIVNGQVLAVPLCKWFSYRRPIIPSKWYRTSRFRWDHPAEWCNEQIYNIKRKMSLKISIWLHPIKMLMKQQYLLTYLRWKVLMIGTNWYFEENALIFGAAFVNDMLTKSFRQ